VLFCVVWSGLMLAHRAESGQRTTLSPCFTSPYHIASRSRFSAVVLVKKFNGKRVSPRITSITRLSLFTDNSATEQVQGCSSCHAPEENNGAGQQEPQCPNE
jgi:hypothetical protein